MIPSDPAETIFLVDDDPAVLRGVDRLLRSAGHAVRSFGSAQEFLTAPGTDAPGCLVRDLTMPGANGLELQEWLSQAKSPPVPHLPHRRGGCPHQRAR